MQANHTKFYQIKSFQPGDILKAFKEIANEFGVPESSLSISCNIKYGDGGSITKDMTFSDLEIVCDLNGQTTSINLSYPSDPKRDYSRDSYVLLSKFVRKIMLYVESTNISSNNTIISIMENNLQLVEMPEEDHQEVIDTNLEARIEIIENKISELSKSPSCFLSYRFNLRGKALALELSRFLTLLNIKVISGLGYEPRSVADKVLGRLKFGHDFFVYLITKDGESTWTRDELAVAFGAGVPVIILVEKGAELGKGILGDWEYIEFDSDHIGDTFIAILEALDYLKEQRLKRLLPTTSNPDV